MDSDVFRSAVTSRNTFAYISAEFVSITFLRLMVTLRAADLMECGRGLVSVRFFRDAGPRSEMPKAGTLSESAPYFRVTQ